MEPRNVKVNDGLLNSKNNAGVESPSEPFGTGISHCSDTRLLLGRVFGRIVSNWTMHCRDRKYISTIAGNEDRQHGWRLWRCNIGNCLHRLQVADNSQFLLYGTDGFTCLNDGDRRKWHSTSTDELWLRYQRKSDIRQQVAKHDRRIFDNYHRVRHTRN